MRTATKALILKALTVAPMTEADLCEEDGLKDLHPKTVRKAIRDLHKEHKIWIKEWVKDQPGQRVYPRPMWTPGRGLDVMPPEKYKKLRLPIYDRKERPPLNDKQRATVELNWDLRIIKGIESQMKNIIYKYVPDASPSIFDWIPEVERRIAEKRKIL